MPTDAAVDAAPGDAPNLPPPPRPVTPRVRRRAWAEPHVRFWWLTALVLLATGAYLGTAGLVAWRRTVRLIESGTPVRATVVLANGEPVKGKNQPPDSVVRLDFTLDGKPWVVNGRLEGRRPGQFIQVGSTIPIRVDPSDPGRWTARETPPPLGLEMLGGLMALGLGVLLLMPALAARAGVLRTWRGGEAAEAVALSQQRSPLAPNATALRCSAVDRDDARVFTVYVPGRVPAGADQPVWVILPTGRGRPLAVAWFE